MNLHAIENEKLLAQGDNSVSLEFTVPASCDFFDGHFPQFKLLPAVGQFEIITRFSAKYLCVSRFVKKIKRVKFSSPILPDTKVTLDLSFDESRQVVSFAMKSSGEGRVFSSGTFAVQK